MAKVIIDPITRIEGHLSIELEVEKGKVVSARSRGDMFRGFEKILRGRNPVDANQITQRICGVCPISHGIASSKCLEASFGIKPNENGMILRDLILAANFIQSHIIHFYHLAAMDYVDITAILDYSGSDAGLMNLKEWAKNDIDSKKGNPDELTAVGPFLPRYGGLKAEGVYIKDRAVNIDAIAGYVKALDIRMKAHKMASLFAGRMPHAIALVPGGITQVPDKNNIREYGKILDEIETFINKEYREHVAAVAGNFKDYYKIGSYRNFMSYGFLAESGPDTNFMMDRGVVLDLKCADFDPSQIREQVGYSRYSSGSNLHPYDGRTDPEPDKARAYTWLKAPRYKNEPLEVGPLARIAVSYLAGNKAVKTELDAVLKSLGVGFPDTLSVLGRHAARYIECKMICARARLLLEKLRPGGSPRTQYTIPSSGMGEGLVEAPRGALGHWISIKNGVIDNYQCVVPTTWYCSPRDDNGVPGPVEEALIGTPIADPENPIEAARVVRSFDPCIACAVHVVEGDREISRFRVL